MNRINLFALLVVVAMSICSCGRNPGLAPVPPAEECAVLGFQYGTNVTSEEVKDIVDNFRVNFRPSNCKLTEVERVEKALGSSDSKFNKMSKQQMCEVGRRLGVKFVVVGNINKLMDEYSVDVQVIDVLKENTIAFEGNAFQKSSYSKELQKIAQRLALKMK